MPDLRTAVHAMMPRAERELAELVAMRSVADPRQYPAAECVRAAEWVRDAVRGTGIDAELVETVDGSHAVVGHRPGPDGAPTVLLYCHYDVQPPGDESLWHTPPFELTIGDDGRWYGRGAADCKGNTLVHLLALRALGDRCPVGIRFVAEGSEEQGTGGLDNLVENRPELFDADMILIADTGNAAVGQPTLTTSLRGAANLVVHVETLSSAVHSGMFGGAAPDALAALIAMLASLRDDAGNTVVEGIDTHQTWDGVEYPEDRFRTDAGVLDGVGRAGSGSVADAVWARPAVTILGIDAPPVVGSAVAVQPKASARLNLRVPPGMDTLAVQDALVAHLERATPFGAKVTFEREQPGSPFRAVTTGPGYRALTSALRDAYGRDVGSIGQGGSIPLCNTFATTFPDAEIALFGVEEPRCLIHAANESVDPSEIENLAVAEALFLRSYGS
ncbi:dipeptidase [Rhodococcus sp. HNM0569]|uniref:dipeptidase n=1 Tax=Rhodococcus sp. HNM0569 TaxID=2716340 RepID=UPI00146D2EB2|nr:dipeptidase [Rhodococcus sp. HNM0569]NLU85102.1 dipeptidase [Rhodococcus sp. HNM0569]